jgi:hypothetical protein
VYSCHRSGLCKVEFQTSCTNKPPPPPPPPPPLLLLLLRDNDDDNDEEDEYDAYKKPNEWPVPEKYSIIARLVRFPDKKAAQTDRLKTVFSDDNFCLVNI